MAELSKSGTPSPCSVEPPPNCRLPGLKAGEAIAAGDALYIKSDGKLWKATGAANNAAAKVVGFAPQAASVNEACGCYFDMNFNYGAALTPGARYYLSGTVAGGLADAASTGGLTPVAYAVDATRIHVWATRE